MTVLEWMFIGCLASVILFLLFACFFLANFVQTTMKIKRLLLEKADNEEKQEMRAFQVIKLTKKKKRSRNSFLILILLAIVLGSGGGYINYYQSMNLSENDEESIVKSYYLIRDFEEQINLAKDQQEEEDKSQKNIRYLATAMASFGTIHASDLNAKDGQITLNRYYNAVKDLGVNGSANYSRFYGNSELSDEYLQNVERVKDYEQQVFAFYNVDELALQEE